MQFITQDKTNIKYLLIVVVLVAIIVGGGILGWIKAQEVTPVELLEIGLSERKELDYKGILSKIFPEKEFVNFEKENCFQDEEEVFYCIDEVREGFFTNTEEKENLFVIKEGYFFSDGKPTYPHVAGITHILLAVFDKESKEILSEPFYLIADTGKVAFYECKNGTNILFYGDSGGQGYITGNTRLLKIEEGKFKTVWPDEKVWNHINTMVKPEKGKLAVYEREYVQSDFICPTDCLIEFIVSEGGLMPSYAFVYSYSMNWNSDTCEFEKDETADWKIYRNEEYGFEFKYPKIYDQKEEYLACRIEESKLVYPELFISVASRVWVQILDPKELTFSEYVDNKINEDILYIESKENINIGGREAVSVSYRLIGSGAYGTMALLEKDKKIYIISLERPNNLCVYEKGDIGQFVVYEKILSTFQFLD